MPKGYDIGFYCGQNNPLPTVNASIWYWQVSPDMIADFTVYKYYYNVYDAGTYLAYAVNGVNVVQNSNPNHASWKANSGTHWGIVYWNVNGSNCMNTFVRNVNLTYKSIRVTFIFKTKIKKCYSKIIRG